MNEVHQKKKTNTTGPQLASIQKKRWPTKKKIQRYLRFIYVTHTHILPIDVLWPNSSTTISQKMINTKKDLTWEIKRSTHTKKNTFSFKTKRWTMRKKNYSWSTHFRRNKNIFTNYFFSSNHKNLCVLFKCAMKKEISQRH